MGSAGRNQYARNHHARAADDFNRAFRSLPAPSAGIHDAHAERPAAIHGRLGSVNALESLRYFIPETIVLAGAFLVLTLDLFLRPKKVLAALSILILIAAVFFIFSPPA